MSDRFVIKLIENQIDQKKARDIFDKTWKNNTETQITSNLLQAMTHGGSYLAGVFVSGQCIGASFAFPTKTDSLRLHSHMTAVIEAFRDTGVGYALKNHQKIWAIDKGYSEITWTFDPLVSRNAKFNLIKLGAEVIAYYPNFYGKMIDSINFLEESDRLMVSWKILNEDVSSKHIVNENRNSDTYIKIPNDINDLKTNSETENQNLRIIVRNQFLEAMKEGKKVVGFSKNNEYILRLD
jgi:predicted GNAT superfamily acetyltransferase